MKGQCPRPIIVWFRRDLRTDDHAALWHAALEHVPIVCLFIVDQRLIAELPSDGAIFNFQAACLDDLDAQLRCLGNHLIILYGHPEEVFEQLFQQLQPIALYYNRDYEPYARERDARVEALARRYDIEVHSFKDHVLVEPWDIATSNGAPFTVFGHFYRAWTQQPKVLPYGAPEHLPMMPGLTSDPLPTAERLGKPVTIQRVAVEPGTSAAHDRWEKFRNTALWHYKQTRDFPAHPEGSSRLSPHLRFGTISIRRIYADTIAMLHDPGCEATARASAEKFIAELAWREFFQHVLWHFPHVVEHSFRAELEDFPWENREDYFRAWCEGCTGYPFVDAAMRELNATGYLPNRARMVAASFLVKDLHIDWRWGERYFRSKLLDGELAANNGNWQWIASTGVDAMPLRIFNPLLQSRRYDPDGAYIRRWVPELRHLPIDHLHEPWSMTHAEQKYYGVRIGVDYPHPIVEHMERKRRFEGAYKEAVRRRNRSSPR
ncbi:MAG: DNA photolyase family protein [Blastocatellia bacterium]|nr:DNA photolyase family protein [Blastocatellia bacterium]MCS7157259.1 DNA photolyase family protein [Blastocatellia bacterium]MDW8256483.1 deoxyribodipyrimidine photo-lyase [Acidobacteriota bacterium]